MARDRPSYGDINYPLTRPRQKKKAKESKYIVTSHKKKRKRKKKTGDLETEQSRRNPPFPTYREFVAKIEYTDLNKELKEKKRPRKLPLEEENGKREKKEKRKKTK